MGKFKTSVNEIVEINRRFKGQLVYSPIHGYGTFDGIIMLGHMDAYEVRFMKDERNYWLHGYSSLTVIREGWDSILKEIFRGNEIFETDLAKLILDDGYVD
jgi:hypothetical protein